MKILITGTAGFIGFHLSKQLLDRGDSVVGVDNLNDYYSVQLKEDRNKILGQESGYKFNQTDISDYSELEKVFDESGDINCVVNLAAQAGVRHSLINPFIYEKSNIKGFLNVLELCRKKNVKNLVYASSSSVYGNCKEYPFKEEYQLDTPLSLYAATKKSNELMAHTYHHLYGLNTIGLRFFTVYGPFGRPDMALFKFVKNILENKQIDVYNNGEMIRDFTYVSDIVNGIVASIDNPMPYEIFNLGRGEPQKLMDFIGAIEEKLGKTALKNMMPLQQGDVPITRADISKAERMLGYKPKISIKEGISNFIDWYQEYYGKKIKA